MPEKNNGDNSNKCPHFVILALTEGKTRQDRSRCSEHSAPCIDLSNVDNYLLTVDFYTNGDY